MTPPLEPHATDHASAERAATFERYRARLFGIAYRMLGCVEDANDLVQETYLRWHRADASAIDAPEGWLVAVVTRLAIDRVRHASVERRAYVGNWLPEPIGGAVLPAPDRGTELASDLSMAFLVLMERLSPEERAAFILREVLGADYATLSRVLEKGEAACRQMVHRARARVRDERRGGSTSAEARRDLVERFLRALAAEDQDALLAVVAPDATFVSDGGGRVTASRRIIQGSDRIVRLLLGLRRKHPDMRYEMSIVNGELALLGRIGERLVSSTSFDIGVGRMVGIYRVLNPEKLRYLSTAGSGDSAVPAINR